MSYQGYFCSEGRAHYNENDMWGYQTHYARDLAPRPPTFINYTIIEKVDEKGLEDYISSLVNEKVDIIKRLIYEKLKADVSLSVEEATRLAFAELGIITEEDINIITEN